MMESKSHRLLLADVGGTHIRFAIGYGGAVEHIRKYRVSDFPDPIQATQRYLSEVERTTHAFDAYLMSSAAVENAPGQWLFSNLNSWTFVQQDFCAQLSVQEFVMVDDFVANACGIMGAQKAESFTTIRQGIENFYPKVVTGCGTGLGLSYLLPQDEPGQYRVHETWGGHMVPAAITQEQREVIDAVQAIKQLDSSPIFEDVVSGPGFSRIYNALKGTPLGKDPYSEGKEILYRVSRGDNVAKDALRLFHEFLGLYLHQAVVYMHAYGGVYLMGGMIDAVCRENLFMKDVVMAYFTMRPVPVVRATLDATPIYWVRDEYIALQGLVNAWDQGMMT